MTDTVPPEPAELWTIRRLLVWATDDFRGRGFDSPRLDAELLLGFAMGKTRIELIMEAERPLDKTELALFRELARRRRAREPTAYILGEREFYGLPFTVDPRVLIPRPDTETLVEVALEQTRASLSSGTMLDLCTGSGCVAIAFALKRSGWRVDAVDLSPDALAVARSNAQSNGLFSLTFHEGDLFEALPAGTRFDVITANPPYIPSADVDQLEHGIRDYEPRLALDGGPDGMRLLTLIVEAAPDWLTPGGLLALELGFDQAGRVDALLSARGFADIRRSRDYGGHERVVYGRWGSQS